MRCSCPWCPKEAESGCVSLVGGSPTCKEHSGEEVLRVLGYTMKELCPKKPDGESTVDAVKNAAK